MEFWESSFVEKGEMWGNQPALSAKMALSVFESYVVKSVLVPGIGYGRNAQVFMESGIEVTGIEISQSAIEMARQHYGERIKIYHGSVTDMPFYNKQYDAVFCYALIHLLDKSERQKLINDCYNQLSLNGCMIFTAITKEAITYGKGRFVSKDRYEVFEGVQMFFYDKESVNEEFGGFGLTEIKDVNESYPFYFIVCRKANSEF